MPILDDLVVVDASWGLAGPVAAMFLTDAGARVIKVEPPGGDPLRWSPGFATWNRGKQSVVLDLSDAADRDRLHVLLEQADVFLHGLTPATATRLGLDDSTLADRYPSLLVAAVTGYPTDHPDAERPAHDILVQARSGLMDEQIVDRPGAAFSRLPLPSWGAAYLSVIAVLARLHARTRTGRGGIAHTSLLQGALTCLTTIWNDAEHPSVRMGRKEPLPKRASPNTFECADGAWIQVNAMYPTVPLLTESLLELGLELPPDDTDPVVRADAYRPVFRQRTAEEWLVSCWSADVSAQPVQAYGELLRDKQVLANDYTVEVDDPLWGRIRQTGTPWSSTSAPAVARPAPQLGRHDGTVESPPARPGVTSTSTPEHLEHPLDGVNVVDFGSFVGGPYVTTLLAQLGANVIKVESKTGDRMRLDDLIFLGTQAGKRSLALDLKSRAAWPIVARLIEWADIVHLNVRSASLPAIGLDYESVRAVNPRVVYCHVSGFGPKGAKRALPVFDPEMQALAGWMRANAGAAADPGMVRCAPTDVLGAMLSLVPTLLALVDRARSGTGAAIEASILGATLMASSETLLRVEPNELATIPVVDAQRRGLAPWYRMFDTADGSIAVAAMTAERRKALSRTIGSEDEADMEKLLAATETAGAVELLAEAGVPAEDVRTNHEIPFLTDDDNLRCRLAVRHHHPLYGSVGQIGSLWNFGDLRTRLDRPAPTLGQHTREILTELGLPDAEIRLLAAGGTIVGDALL